MGEALGSGGLVRGVEGEGGETQEARGGVAGGVDLGDVGHDGVDVCDAEEELGEDGEDVLGGEGGGGGEDGAVVEDEGWSGGLVGEGRCVSRKDLPVMRTMLASEIPKKRPEYAARLMPTFRA